MDIPAEFAQQGIKSPKEAADYIDDIVGSISVARMDEHAKRARDEGRAGEALFYEAARDILIAEYEEADRRAAELRDDSPGSEEAWEEYLRWLSEQ